MSELELEQQAWSDLLSGNIRQAAGDFLKILRENINATDSAGGYTACLVFAGAKDEAESFLKHRREIGDVGLVAWRVVSVATRYSVHGYIDKLYDFLDQQSILSGPIAYAKGHLLLSEKQVAASLPFFSEAREFFTPYAEDFTKRGDTEVSSIYGGLRNFRDREFVDAAFARSRQPESGFAPVNWVHQAEACSRPVLFVAADANYVRTFFPKFAASLEKTGGTAGAGRPLLHLHLGDGDADDVDFARSVAQTNGLNLGLTTFQTNCHVSVQPATYASARFFAVLDLLKFYKRPILTLDIDLALRQPVDRLFEAASDKDFACYIRPDQGPHGYCYAAATYISPNEEAKSGADTFMRFVRSYIDMRLAEKREAFWFVDQVALFQAFAWLPILTDVPISIGDLSEAGEFASYFDHGKSRQNKRR